QALRGRGFRLFANSDGAATGMRGAGDFSWATDNYSPCDAPLSGFCAYYVHPRRNPSIATFQHFEILTAAAAPPSAWAKILAVAPSAANARGGGWVSLINFALFAGRLEWGPADGQLGTLFSGVTSTDDGTCRDNTGFADGFLPVGLRLLAGSDCPETWPADGFGGDRPIPAEAWRQLFAQQRSAFQFDYWRVPDSLKAHGALGDRFATYGEISDHYAEILASYGSVVPGGVGEPQFEGYPLGLIWRFDAFNFNAPGLEDVHFWRATVINRSEDVWGSGISYDSLYLGFMVGTGAAGAGGGDRKSWYFRPDLSAVIFHQSRVRVPGPCDEGFRRPTGVSRCSFSPAGAGYGNGATVTLVLKSPIGDLRNKLFTRVGSRFYDPSHASAGDTITFNHGHMCGFGGCWANTHNVNDRRSFGMFSSTDDNTLDGRDAQALAGTSTGWRTWRAANYPTEVAKFNKYVPGVMGPPAATWDWNHDGLPDTLYYTTCGLSGCVEQDWDTLPGGLVNTYSNIGGVISAGPFRLGAGDSTSWFVAFIGSRDSVPMWSALEAATEAYLGFFPRAEAPPAPRVVATQTSPPGLLGVTATATAMLFFDAPAERWIDPYLESIADQLENAAAGSGRGELRDLNPWLVDSLRVRARSNLEGIEVYKSCDGGRTFTADDDCDGDPAVGTRGERLGVGWQAYAWLPVDRSVGGAANVFTDSSVAAGRTYTYVLVAKTRGVTLLVETIRGPDNLTFAPSLRTPFEFDDSAPYAVDIYVPASREAGGRGPTVRFLERPAGVTVPFEVIPSDSVRPGSYRALFGNRFVITRDSIPSQERVVETRIRVEHTVRVDFATVAIRTEEFVRRDNTPIPVAGRAQTTVETGPDLVRQIDTYVGVGFILVDGNDVPIYVTVTLSGLRTFPGGVLGSRIDPGFVISADQRPAGTFDVVGELHLRAGRTDTLSRSTVDSSMVQWMEQRASRNPAIGGRYRIRWAGDPFGLTDGVLLNFTSPKATESELAAALQARPRATIGASDPATAVLFGLAAEALVPASFPFVIENETFDRTLQIMMLRRPTDSILLGSGADTLRVAIPPNEWIPGDLLVLIERVTEDSVDRRGRVVLGADSQPIRIERARQAFAGYLIACAFPRLSCNPVKPGTPGATGYEPIRAGDESVFHYFLGFQPDSRYEFEVVGPVAGGDITSIEAEDLERIRVVPNPFVLFSAYQTDPNDPRIIFTHVPPIGVLRIYTVSGQFVQQISWTPADLMGAGDLHVSLITRGGRPFASGLYIWVLTAPSLPDQPASRPIRARGKFV
ncbi:MAG: hypothetical protein IH965_14975, partial [Gemmatimonadetes bacterium]|nr:hypothetical protein [Gemmatimonadota bacterium]